MSTNYSLHVTFADRPSGWFHIVMVLHGAGDELVAYQDKVATRSTEKQLKSNHQLYSGKTVIGRTYVDDDSNYTSLILDELTFWNRPLTQEEVDQLYGSVMGYLHCKHPIHFAL